LIQVKMPAAALLVIADVPRGGVEAITERIKKVHPKAEPEGTEPRVPAFP
jgi:hypothetical protein